MSKTIRLNKVLRELNISIDRVAEFLSSKGHSIEKRPTTKISQELYDLLCDEFHVDADKKIASQEAVEAKNKEKQELREKHENLVLGSKKESEVIRASSKVVQFKKLGKIDLEKKSSEISTPKIDQENSLEKPNFVSSKKDNYKTLSGLKSTGETIDLDKFKKNPGATTVDIQYGDYGFGAKALSTRLGLGRFNATKLDNGKIRIRDTFNVDKDFTTIGFADIVPGLQKTADRLVDISYKTRNIKGRTDEGGIKIDVLIDSGFVKKKRGSAFNKIKKMRNK